MQTIAEYITKKAAINAVENAPIELFQSEWEEIEEAINAAPAADVVPVVRCKDCIHYDLGVCLKIYSDGNAQKDSWQSRNPNDFCSYGVRKDGGVDNY